MTLAKVMASPADAAARWQQNFGAAGPRWAQGIQAVTVPPGQAAAAAVDRYLAGTQAAAPKFARNVAAVPLATWKDVSVSKGQGRLASGAQAGLAKYQAAITRVLDAEKSIIGGLPPRGSVEQNIQRSAEFQRQMHAAFAAGG